MAFRFRDQLRFPEPAWYNHRLSDFLPVTAPGRWGTHFQRVYHLPMLVFPQCHGIPRFRFAAFPFPPALAISARLTGDSFLLRNFARACAAGFFFFAMR